MPENWDYLIQNAKEWPDGTVAVEHQTGLQWEVVDGMWEHEKAHDTLRSRLLYSDKIIYNPQDY